jgi:L-alanine-DL-glutamate epimerase-like enolase superfamily enzyme
MILQSIEPIALTIPFKQAFKHASAERRATQSLWIRTRTASGAMGFGEGCPREYVTAESMSTAFAFVDRRASEWLAGFDSVGAVSEWVRAHRSEIDANPAAWTAVELSVFDVLGKEQRVPVEGLLGLPPLSGRFLYTAVIGDGPPEQFANQLDRYVKQRFEAFKIKLSADMSENREKVRLLNAAGIAANAVRADANNLWRSADACIADLESLKFKFNALEEPLIAGDWSGLTQVAKTSDIRIILDESVSREEHLDALGTAPDRWIINCRVSKMGGLLRSLELLRSAQSRDLHVIVGAHVGETSVLTRAALTLAAAARGVLLAQEGAFGTHLLSHDMADPPLMFGVGGAIHLPASGLGAMPGLGLNIAEGAGT